MAIQHIVNDKGEPTHVIMTIEEWQGLMSSNANNIKSTNSHIEILDSVQEEMKRRMEKVTVGSGILRKDLRDKLGI